MCCGCGSDAKVIDHGVGRRVDDRHRIATAIWHVDALRVISNGRAEAPGMVRGVYVVPIRDTGHARKRVQGSRRSGSLDDVRPISLMCFHTGGASRVDGKKHNGQTREERRRRSVFCAIPQLPPRIWRMIRISPGRKFRISTAVTRSGCAVEHVLGRGSTGFHRGSTILSSQSRSFIAAFGVPGHE